MPLDAGSRFKNLCAQVRRCSAATGSVMQGAGFRLRQRDQFIDRRCGHCGIYHEKKRRRCNQAHGYEIPDEIVVELRVQRGADRLAGSRHQKRITVRRCMRDNFSAHVAASASAVVRDDLLAPGVAEFAPDESRNDIRTGAGCTRDDDANRSNRV